MNVTTWREARFIMVKDSLLAIATRLGYMGTDLINEVPVAQGIDGWNVKVYGIKGVGLRIRHTMEVEIWHADEGQTRWKFTVDVLGPNQCKNCYFPDLSNNGKNVNELTEDEFSDVCFLPEVFGDFVATEVLNHYNRG